MFCYPEKNEELGHLKIYLTISESYTIMLPLKLYITYMCRNYGFNDDEMNIDQCKEEFYGELQTIFYKKISLPRKIKTLTKFYFDKKSGVNIKTEQEILPFIKH